MVLLAVLASSAAVAFSLPVAAAAADPARERPAPAPADRAAPAPPPAAGEDEEARDDAAARKKLEEDIARELGGAGPAPAGAAQATPPQRAEPPQPPPGGRGTSGGNPLARLLLLPDLSAIGRAVAAYQSHDVEVLSPRSGPFGPEDRLEFQLEEVELGIQAAVDPYLRADLFVAFTPEGAEVEEAFVTTLALPAGMQLRAGKLLAPFGRQNQQHPDAWDFVDAPLARARLLAEEALSGAGVDVGWLAPLPWFAELRVAAFSSEELPAAPLPEAPLEEDRPRLTGLARLLQYVGLGEATTVGVGVSAARREEAGPGAWRDLGGIDVHLRYRPLATRAYLALEGELYARRFEGIPEVDDGFDAGGWAQAFWRRSARTGLGVRYERAPAEAPGLDGTEQRWSALASFFPSEFQRVRLQVSYDRLPGGEDGVEALLHLEFGVGAHGAHPF